MMKKNRDMIFWFLYALLLGLLLSLLKIMTEVMARSSQIVNGAKSVMVKLHGSLVKSPKKDDKAIISLIVLLDGPINEKLD